MLRVAWGLLRRRTWSSHWNSEAWWYKERNDGWIFCSVLNIQQRGVRITRIQIIWLNTTGCWSMGIPDVVWINVECDPRPWRRWLEAERNDPKVTRTLHRTFMVDMTPFWTQRGQFERKASAVNGHTINHFDYSTSWIFPFLLEINMFLSEQHIKVSWYRGTIDPKAMKIGRDR